MLPPPPLMQAKEFSSHFVCQKSVRAARHSFLYTKDCELLVFQFSDTNGDVISYDDVLLQCTVRVKLYLTASTILHRPRLSRETCHVQFIKNPAAIHMPSILTPSILYSTWTLFCNTCMLKIDISCLPAASCRLLCFMKLLYFSPSATAK